MTADEFWGHIRASRRRDPQAHAERLVARLAKLTPDEIVGFGRVWNQFRAAAYTNTLWGAAYLMNGGCSDDGFTDFRSWLLLQGRQVYESAVADPETLATAKWEPDEVECECYPPTDAYTAATGATLDESFAAVGVVPDTDATLGETWDFDDDAEMRRRYPKLYARCSADD